MYPRIFKSPTKRSFFLFGPRGTGKSSWLRENFANCPYVDLLEDETYRTLLSRPETLESFIKPGSKWVVMNEVQRIPDLLNEVHRLIELKNIKFALSGSSAKKPKKIRYKLACRKSTYKVFTSLYL
ncbi:MAG: AAA family ATPase [Bdellovibrionota bacterium]